MPKLQALSDEICSTCGQVQRAYEKCNDCSRGMVPIKVWKSFSIADRERLLESGCARAGAKGLCSRCYQHHKRYKIAMPEKVANGHLTLPQVEALRAQIGFKPDWTEWVREETVDPDGARASLLNKSGSPRHASFDPVEFMLEPLAPLTEARSG